MENSSSEFANLTAAIWQFSDFAYGDLLGAPAFIITISLLTDKFDSISTDQSHNSP